VNDATKLVHDSLTMIVADDTVNMVQWWADRGVETPISGDDLARTRNLTQLHNGRREKIAS